jgi:ParB-like chromosome segregation protein Spo0J
MEFHPLAEIFPLMEGEALSALVEDIRKNGLKSQITLYEDKIIDGRNRWRACKELNLPFGTKKLNGEDPLAFVMSENLHRRHLTKQQSALAAARAANMRQGERTDIQPSANLQKVSQDDAAKLFKVSPRSVATAARILKEGNDADIAEADSGAASLGDISNRIKKRQPEELAKGRERKKKADEPRQRARQEKSVVQTIIIASQQLEAAAGTLEQIETIPDLGERMNDVIQNLRSAQHNTGRFVRRLEALKKDREND